MPMMTRRMTRSLHDHGHGPWSLLLFGRKGRVTFPSQKEAKGSSSIMEMILGGQEGRWQEQDWWSHLLNDPIPPISQGDLAQGSDNSSLDRLGSDMDATILH
jgi:hypothetical protein